MSAPTVKTYPSRTRPDHKHTVTIFADGGLTCTCEAGRHGQMCWAQRKALAADARGPLPLTEAAEVASDRAYWQGVMP